MWDASSPKNDYYVGPYIQNDLTSLMTFVGKGGGNTVSRVKMGIFLKLIVDCVYAVRVTRSNCRWCCETLS